MWRTSKARMNPWRHHGHSREAKAEVQTQTQDGTAAWFRPRGAALGGGLGHRGIGGECFIAGAQDWRDSLQGDDWKTRLGPYVVCGAAAGLMAGFLVGGFTGALFFAVLGGCTAGALTWIDMRKGLDGPRSG